MCTVNWTEQPIWLLCPCHAMSVAWSHRSLLTPSFCLYGSKEKRKLGFSFIICWTKCDDAAFRHSASSFFNWAQHECDICWLSSIPGRLPRLRHWPHSLFVDVLYFLGQTVHTGGKPHAVFQGGDAHQCCSRADVPPIVRPEEKKRVGPTLWVSSMNIFCILHHLTQGNLHLVHQQNKLKGRPLLFCIFIIVNKFYKKTKSSTHPPSSCFQCMVKKSSGIYTYIIL